MNALLYEQYRNSYPNIIETITTITTIKTITITHIMYRTEIPYTNNRLFYRDYNYYDKVIKIHTNVEKYTKI